MTRLAIIIACLIWPAATLAGQQCYSPAEIDAERLLRLHSELMVITVTCHPGSQGEDLVPAYTGCTQANLKALHSAEQTMIAYYHKTFGGDGTEMLDKLRTRLGNAYGSKIASMSAPAFCAMYRDKVLKMCGADQAALHAEIERIAADENPANQQCLPASNIAKSGK